MNPVQYILVGCIRLYQLTLSPLLAVISPAPICRYNPSCSQYALEAVRSHGALYGIWLATKRLARCHPWGGHGHDPVPAKLRH